MPGLFGPANVGIAPPNFHHKGKGKVDCMEDCLYGQIFRVPYFALVKDNFVTTLSGARQSSALEWVG